MNALRKPDPPALAKAKQLAELQRAENAIDLLGGFVGPKVYNAVRQTWMVRLGAWLTRGDCTAADVAAACEAMSTPEALAGIEYGETEFSAALSRRIMVERNARLDRERAAAEEAERRRWAEQDTQANRATVRKLLAGVGTRVGKDRRTQPPRFTRGESQTRTEEDAGEGTGQTATEAVEPEAQAEGGEEADPGEGTPEV